MTKAQKHLLIFLAFFSVSTSLIAQKVTNEEAILLNEHFKQDTQEFDFTGKKVYFFLSTKPWTKEEFFNDLIKWKEEGSQISAQYVVLNESQKKESGGYDVFVYAWSKKLIAPKQMESHIEKMKKARETPD